ncbi:TetR/AcrR family transcriptional regulator [Catellatospora coxensis]|uniref:TetR family transcriptional regulator n=1 Tax=Catellatospora coxensis TaxID=310354 RepID=A0A8J3PBP3_9ACTN|nr:TetR/AcrR family transcriptional regulator [Catellatospora coxensis]GIG11581.1 TetR family transcriptional regulator [Catellatospora coxensis]
MRTYDGKSAEERRAERRERLIDAGLELFAAHGFASTSIRAVLRTSGLQERYFGESFPDLDHLLAAVHDRILDQELTACRTALDGPGTPAQRVRAMLGTLMDLLAEDPGRARIKMREVTGAGPVSLAHRRQGVSAFAELICELLPPPAAGGEPDRFFLAVGLVAAVYELMTSWVDGEPDLNPKKICDLGTMLFEAVTARLDR